MRLVRADVDRVEFGFRRSTTPAFLVGLGFAVMAALPLFGPGAMTVARAVTAAILGAIAVFMLRAGRPGTTVHVTIDPRHNQIASPDGYSGSIDTLRLTGRAEGDDHREPTYAVEAVISPDRTIALLRDSDPAEVLSDMSRALSYWDVPVELGWGLPPESTPWVASGSASSVELANEIETKLDPAVGSRHAGYTTLFFGLAVGCGMGFMITSRVVSGSPPSALGVTLPIATTVVMLLCGAALSSRHQRVRVADGHLTRDVRVLGLPFRRSRTRLKCIRNVYLVSPDGGAPTHLLFESENGPTAVGCPPGQARALHQALLPAGRD